MKLTWKMYVIWLDYVASLCTFTRYIKHFFVFLFYFLFLQKYVIRYW